MKKEIKKKKVQRQQTNQKNRNNIENDFLEIQKTVFKMIKNNDFFDTMVIACSNTNPVIEFIPLVSSSDDVDFEKVLIDGGKRFADKIHDIYAFIMVTNVGVGSLIEINHEEKSYKKHENKNDNKFSLIFYSKDIVGNNKLMMREYFINDNNEFSRWNRETKIVKSINSVGWDNINDKETKSKFPLIESLWKSYKINLMLSNKK